MAIKSALAPRLDDIKTPPPLGISPGASLRTAARRICVENQSLLLVGEPGVPLAVVSERDLTRALARGDSPDTAVKDIADTSRSPCPPTPRSWTPPH